MEILNNYWTAQTAIFLTVFALAVFVSVTRKNDSGPLPKETSNELRGLAILGVIFAHLTYGRFYDTQFLFPVGIWGGIAVDLFFFLSGYGLAASAIYHSKSPLDFYKKRLTKIYWPLWLSLALVLILDFLVLQRTYSATEIIQAFFGFFPAADLWHSINAPLWFLTPLLFFYLVFPWLFKSKHPRWSVLAIFAVSGLVFWGGWPVSEQIAKYYQIHYLAFPLGVLLASLIVSPAETCRFCGRQDGCLLWRLERRLKRLFGWAKEQKFLARFLMRLRRLSPVWHWLVVVITAGGAAYLAYYSGVGQGIVKEQFFSLAVMALLLILFIAKKTKFRLLEIIGAYSFEIYLLHWPLLGRYDFFYKFLSPAWGTIAYLAALILLAAGLHNLISLEFKKAPR